MSWVKVDDNALDDPRALGVSRSARLLHFEGLAYSNRLTTGGLVPRGALRRITDADDSEALAAELVGAGLWEEAEDGWTVAWLLDDQPTADEAAEAKEQARARQARSRRHKAGDHSTCDPKRCWALLDRSRAVTRDEPGEARDGHVTSRVSHAHPTRPDPTRPEGEGREGSGSPSRSAGAPRSARRGEGIRALDKAQRDVLKAMGNGDRCWTCSAEFAEDERTTDLGPMGRMLGRTAHRQDVRGDVECVLPLPEGYASCDECQGAFPVGAMVEVYGGNYHACPPGFGCGGPECVVCGESVLLTDATPMVHGEKVIGPAHDECAEGRELDQ